MAFNFAPSRRQILTQAQTVDCFQKNDEYVFVRSKLHCTTDDDLNSLYVCSRNTSSVPESKLMTMSLKRFQRLTTTLVLTNCHILACFSSVRRIRVLCVQGFCFILQQGTHNTSKSLASDWWAAFLICSVNKAILAGYHVKRRRVITDYETTSCSSGVWTSMWSHECSPVRTTVANAKSGDVTVTTVL